MGGSGLEDKYEAALKMCMGNGKADETGDGKPTGKPSGKGKPTGKPSGNGKPTGKPSGNGKPTGKPNKPNKPSGEGKGGSKPNKPNKPSGKGKGKGKGGNSGKCPDFADIIQMIEKEYKTEYCVLQAVEWVDEKGNIDEDVIKEDISKLPAGVQEGLDEDKMKMCVQDMMADMKDDLGDCFDDFTDEQQGELVMMAEHISNYECFMKSFKYACEDYIKNDVMEIVTNALSSGLTGPSGKGGKRFC